MPESTSAKDRLYIPLIAAVSVLVPLLVALLHFLPHNTTEAGDKLLFLPLFHAVLNGLTAALLLAGYFFIRRRKITLHRLCMLLALGLSIVFLLSYVTYHASVPPARYAGTGGIRYLYFSLLISHILLAAIIVPMALLTVYRSFSLQFAKHRRLAKWTLPLWLYVAITGVLVYLMMRPYYPMNG